MKNNKLIYWNIFIVSASGVCFEIISTRISSVIFVNDYAFFILSLAILGLGCGGIFCYYRINNKEVAPSLKIISRSLLFFGVSLCLFVISVIKLTITDPFIYFILLFIPFFFAGIAYAQVFKIYAEHSFKLYAADLSGAALGSIVSLGLFSFYGAPNSILLLAVIVFATALSFSFDRIHKKRIVGGFSFLFLLLSMLIYNGKNDFLGMVPIGNYPEKDFFHVYPYINTRCQIIDSRWSVYGRSDLVEYSHQDVVKQLFIDGAAGSPVYRFNGNVNKPDRILLDLLVRQPNSIPFLFLKKNEKNNMLVIGPGGGKEVLMGLFSGVEKITGVEINPDFVDIVKEHKNFDGGIYTDFPNVEVLVKEGRHYIKQVNQKYDIIAMAFPSTEQIQNIEAFAMSENYLVTSEAIHDYLKILTPEGSLFLTVHDRWELKRLITTAIFTFKELGVNSKDAINHFAILESDYAPTLIIKNNPFTEDGVVYWQNTMKKIPRELPSVSFLPYSWNQLDRTDINQLLMSISQDNDYLQKYIERYEYDISPCRDDSPYFYKIIKGVPADYLWLLFGIVVFNIFIIILPLKIIEKKVKKNSVHVIVALLIVFICIGLGFMILEVSLFQKLVLYLGSPAVSLSILLSSLLTGMGIGSFRGKKIYETNAAKRLSMISLLIVMSGIPLFILFPLILSKFLIYSLLVRCTVCFFLILPFGFLLGIPFPSCIQLLKQENMEKYIPWMYGVNGTMSVLGSVLAVILSMLFGFTPTFYFGLSFYLIVHMVLRFSKIRIKTLDPLI
jgi:predicted membrane-bound spermidine synthase